jgi:SnoaL-like domain
MTDREAITDLIYRYCRAMDRIDPELGYSIWHPDGTADYGANVFQGSGRDFVDHVCAQHRGTLNHSHQVTNIIIALEGDRASSESYCTATLRIMRGDVLMQISVWNRYIDTWSKRDGRWGIDARLAVIDFDEIRPVTAMSQTSRGSRDRNDPSYGVLT